MAWSIIAVLVLLAVIAVVDFWRAPLVDEYPTEMVLGVTGKGVEPAADLGDAGDAETAETKVPKRETRTRQVERPAAESLPGDLFSRGALFTHKS